MKVLQLIDTLAPGGAERMCVNIANLLYSSKIPVVVCATRAGGTLESQISPGIPKYVLNKAHPFDLRAFIRFLSILKKEGITHIHAHSSSIFWAISASFFFRKIKIIWHDHYGQSESLQIGDRKLLSLLSWRINSAIAVNKTLEQWIKKSTHIPEAQILYLPNFPVLEIPDLAPSNPPLIVCLANFRPQKNHLNLLKAISILRSRTAAFQVVLSGLPGEPTYMNTIYDNIRADIYEKVIIEHNTMNSGLVLNRASIGVLSSDSEGLPLALLEYGLAGLPVVCTRVGQCADVVEEGRCGWLVPPQDPEALAAALYEVLMDLEHAKVKGQHLKERVMKAYSGETFLAGYKPLLA